ncbi:MAG: succinate dehydrogenase assembly factor 2 [Kiloniellales bacterium]
MTETIETRRKRLRFRSWHRGTREADLLLGRFADHYLDRFSDRELRQYEELIGHSDPDIYNWISDREPIPEPLRNPVTILLKDFSKRRLGTDKHG